MMFEASAATFSSRILLQNEHQPLIFAPLPSLPNDGVERKPKSLVYTAIFWTAFCLFSLWAVLDRFFVNLWPMTLNYEPLSVSLVANNVSVSIGTMLFDNFGRASGRFFLVCIDALLWTSCQTTAGFIERHVGGSVKDANVLAHNVIGFAMTGLLLLHVLFVLLPLIKAPIMVGDFRPPTRVTPWIYVNNGIAEAFLTYTDIAIACVAGLALLFLLPIFHKKMRLSIVVHVLHLIGVIALFASLLATWHAPHALFFCLPLLAYYVLDKCVGFMLARRRQHSEGP